MRKNLRDTPTRRTAKDVSSDGSSRDDASYKVHVEGDMADIKAEKVLIPNGNQIVVVGSPDTVRSTVVTLRKSGLDRFRRLYSAEAAPSSPSK
jgi:hypothetical protein